MDKTLPPRFVWNFDEFGGYEVVDPDLLLAVSGGESNIGVNTACPMVPNDVCASPNVSCPDGVPGNAVCADVNWVCGGQAAADGYCGELNGTCG